jgi:hypothetical protein
MVNNFVEFDAMNSWDQNNLDFLYQLDPQALLQWAEQASGDDLEYAMELLFKGIAELQVQLCETLDSQDLDVSQAAAILQDIANRPR